VPTRECRLCEEGEGTAESVVTNQSLYLLSYAGVSLHTIDRLRPMRPPYRGRLTN